MSCINTRIVVGLNRQHKWKQPRKPDNLQLGNYLSGWWWIEERRGQNNKFVATCESLFWAKDLKRVHRDVRIWIIKELRERDSQYDKCALEQMLLGTTIVGGKDVRKLCIWQQRTSLELNLKIVCWRKTRMTNDWSSRRRRKTCST